jgi:hypothetical protein
VHGPRPVQKLCLCPLRAQGANNILCTDLTRTDSLVLPNMVAVLRVFHRVGGGELWGIYFPTTRGKPSGAVVPC